MLSLNTEEFGPVTVTKYDDTPPDGPVAVAFSIADFAVQLSFKTPVHGWGWCKMLPEGVWQAKGTAHVYLHIDGMGKETWYLFAHNREKVLFKQMLEGDGIGPGTALTILAHTPTDTILELIAAGDRHGFRLLKGVGLKTKRADELEKILFKEAPAQPAVSKLVLNENVVAVLKKLGYQAEPAKKAVRMAMETGTGDETDEELTKACLKLLNTSKSQ